MKPKQSKTSSAGAQGASAPYELRTVIYADWRMPTQLKVSDVHGITGGLHSYVLTGALTDVPANPSKWKVPPHRAFANLPMSHPDTSANENLPDQAAMIGFIKKYGFLANVSNKGAIRESVEPRIRPTSALVADKRFGRDFLAGLAVDHSPGLLQFAWETSDEDAVVVIQSEASRGLTLALSPHNSAVSIVAPNLWTFICLLFIRDHGAGKTGVCLNPECPAPYFIRRRRTQRICESGDCVSWFQRQHALKWWRENRGKGATIPSTGVENDL
ncbi:hypothetical protein [Granulicella aggregans]|uniref:hypothetical protein n=1 Tax=Granulicella aggregans TaxID=474949 RepID=UPI0021E0DE66|nr:hypothetical protein [Granulicella aggregans]